MTGTGNATAWGLPGVQQYFSHERQTTAHVYPSEWHFLKQHLKEEMSILDIGCSHGGFKRIIGENIRDFSYVGLDINHEMIETARASHPDAEFHLIEEADFSVLGSRNFDLVLILGILHLHERWRDTLKMGWAHTHETLIFDLRQISDETIENKSRSFFRMNFGGGGADHENTILPYNLINSAEALTEVESLNAPNVSQYGYIRDASDAAECPVSSILFNTWCLRR